VSYLLSPETRLSAMGGFSNNRFQIPDVPGQTPSFSLNGSDSIDSATLDARQKERNRFGVLALQSTLGEGWTTSWPPTSAAPTCTTPRMTAAT
jgi:hypothetical protein